jgi:hypothetical protein
MCRCLTTEVIMEFEFAKSANMLEEEDSTFESWFLTAFDAITKSVWKMQEFPLLRKTSALLPDSLVTLIDPQIAIVFRMLKVLLNTRSTILNGFYYLHLHSLLADRIVILVC